MHNHTKAPMITAPVITISRLRMGSDGRGVTSLIIFHGCPLRCKYCINPYSFAADTPYTEMTSAELYDKVKIDALYYLATNGGVTFGGGEPLLRADFIKQFREICGEEWHLCAETSLCVPREAVTKAAEAIDHFYVDCKDMNPDIYKRYTGQKSDTFRENLAYLLSLVSPDRVTVRLPLIYGFNTEEDRANSRRVLTEMGVTNFNELTYQIRKA